MTDEPITVVPCANLDDGIDEYIRYGYKIDMIVPSDAPREVQMSRHGKSVTLRSKNRQHSSNVDWTIGRAGMMYRDLIPSRLGGRLIASHIRLTEGGTVADYVHYHKVDFQLIYSLRGRIRVVYEGQGEPFWIEPGDCVLQPPEIRHRVLECEAGSEALELSSPAEHETWVDHELTLPTAEADPEWLFGGQRFVRSVAQEATWQPTETNGVELRDTGIFAATSGLLDVSIRRTKNSEDVSALSPRPGMTALGFVVAGKDKPDNGWGNASVVVADTPEPVTTEILRIEFRDSESKLAHH